MLTRSGLRTGGRQLAAGLCLALFLALGGTARAQSDETPASAQFNQAYKLLVHADGARDGARFADAVTLYRQALDAYKGLIQKYPDWQSGIVRFRIAYCQNQLDVLGREKGLVPAPAEASTGQTVEAQSPLPDESQSLSGSPLDADTLRAQAQDLLREDRPDDARLLLMDGLRQEPDNPAIRLLLSLVQCRVGKFEDASYLVEELVQEDPSNAVAHVVLGTTRFAMGRLEDAEKELNAALAIDPGLPEAHYDLARLLLSLEPADIERARQHYKKAIDLGAERDSDLDFLLE